MNQDYPNIVVIKRTGADGPKFTLHRNVYLFGRDIGCDLRVQLPGVALQHAKIFRSENDEFFLENLTEGKTIINGNEVKESVALSNEDIFTIAERSFRFEFKRPSRKSFGQPKRLSTSKPLTSTSPLREANEKKIKNSPRHPVVHGSSLRESVDKLRRSSVPLLETDEPPQTESCALRTTNTPQSTKKSNKRVSFGPNLSPEQFDKSLPVSTPIKKGATPQRLSAPLSKPCLSPGRKRNSVVASSFVSKLEEVVEEEESKKSDMCELKIPSSVNEVADVIQPKMTSTSTTENVEKNRADCKKTATPLREAIRKGFRLKETKKKLMTPLRREIAAGKILRASRNRPISPARKAIETRPKPRNTRRKMSTPVRKGIQAGLNLKRTKKVMTRDLQNDIKKGIQLRQTKKIMPKPLQEEIKSGRQFLKTTRTVETTEEDYDQKVENTLYPKMPVELQAAIIEGVQLRVTRRRLPILLQNEIKSSIELSKTKQSLKTPIRKEIEYGVSLRKTKRRMGTMLQDEIKSGIELSKTKQSLKTPIRKEIEYGVSLRKTKRRMGTMLQDEIKSGIELSKTKQSLKTPIRKEIESGVHLRKTKRRMGTMLQDEIKSGIERSKTKEKSKALKRKSTDLVASFKTPKRRKSCVSVDATQSSLRKMKTPSKTARRSGFIPRSRSKRSISRLDSIKQPSYADILKRPKITGKRRLSTRKTNAFKFEADPQVPSKTTAKKSRGVRPTCKEKVQTSCSKNQVAKAFDGKTNGDWNVVVNKRKILKIKRQRAVKQQEEVNLVGVDSLFKTPKATCSVVNLDDEKDKKSVESFIGNSPLPSKDNLLFGVAKLLKSPKSPKNREPCIQGVAKLFEDGKRRKRSSSMGNTKLHSDDSILYGVAKLMKTPKIRRYSEPNLDGVSELFQESKIARRPLEKRQKECDDSILYGVAKLMKTPKMKKSEPSYEGVPELFEIEEMVSPITVTKTPSLRRPSDQFSAVAPLSTKKTPSLRMKDTVKEFAFPLQLSSTPSFRDNKCPQTIAIAETVNIASSLRQTGQDLVDESVDVSVRNPSLKNDASSLVQVEFSSVGGVSTNDSNAVSETTTIKRRSTRKQYKTKAVAVADQASSTEALEQVECLTPKRRTTRSSKRKAELTCLPEKKRPRRAVSVKSSNTEQSFDAVVQPVTCNDTISHSSLSRKSKRTRCVANKEPTHPVTCNTRSTRSKDICLVVKAEDSTCGVRKENAVHEDVVTADVTKTRSRKQIKKNAEDSVDNIATAIGTRRRKVNKTNSENEVSFQVEEIGEVTASAIDKKRALRNIDKQPSKVGGKREKKPTVALKMPICRNESKNVVGVPDTPPPFTFTKTKLDPIIEVPTPPPSVEAEVCFGGARSTRNPRIADVNNVSSVTCENEGKEHASPYLRGKGKKVAPLTRATRSIKVLNADENLPGANCQKKEKVTDDHTSSKGIRSERRSTRRNPQQSKIIAEEITVSNARTNRRNKLPEKDFEIIEETVVTYTRTRRKRACKQENLQENIEVVREVKMLHDESRTDDKGFDQNRITRTSLKKKALEIEDEPHKVKKQRKDNKSSENILSVVITRASQKRRAVENDDKTLDDKTVKQMCSSRRTRKAEKNMKSEPVTMRLTRSRRCGK